ncbi:MAG: hypothetical protein ACREBG_10755 [Pyrinomonadaceae bacterium]
MGINLRGFILEQPQLDEIVPVLNDHMNGLVSKKKFEQACVDACEKAGCPLRDDQERAK